MIDWNKAQVRGKEEATTSILYRFEMQLLLVKDTEYLVEFKYKGDPSIKEKFYQIVDTLHESWKEKTK